LHLIEVCFKGNRKEFFQWNGDEPPPLKSHVVVEADRGEDLGHVHAVGELATRRAEGCAHGSNGEETTRVARRLATPEEVRRLRELRDQDESARRKALERVKANDLSMKLSDAEWRWDRRKLTIYFTAEKRVDFRNLVRELAAMFRTRIELKQIGVRDEARRLSGIGRCGREYCSASWLPELRPVNLGIAKDQRLSLNPSQISGACGRLMCCLRYEHEFYVQQRKRFPKEGKAVITARGEERVVSNDIFRERVTLRAEDGETRVLPLVELRREMGVDRTIEVPLEEDTPTTPLEGLPDEVIGLQDTSELPAWLPRPATPQGRRPLPVAPPGAAGGDAPTASTRELPRPQPAPEAADTDSSEGAEGSDEDASAQGRRDGEGRRGRRRRRGRRGGRRGRPGDRPGDGGGAGGGDGGTADSGPSGAPA
jgi:cell fate regulator YaaT (PSP1 superfamily)